MTWCERHWKPYAHGEPGGLVASVKLMQMATGHPRIVAYVGPAGEPERLNAAIREFGPLCCLMGDAYMARLLAWTQATLCLMPYRLTDRATDRDTVCHREKDHQGGHDHFWPQPDEWETWKARVVH